MELGSILSTGMIGFQKSRGWLVAPNLKSQGEHNYCNADQGWSDSQGPSTCQDWRQYGVTIVGTLQMGNRLEYYLAYRTT